MPFVYSTAPADCKYVAYVTKKLDSVVEPATVVKAVTIRGGYGIADKNTGYTAVLPIVTEVTTDEAAFLTSNESFKKHQELGYMKLTTNSVSTEKIVDGMEKIDNSMPLSDAELTKGSDRIKQVPKDVKVKSGKD